MDKLVVELKVTLPATFESEEVRDRRKALEEALQAKSREAFAALSEKARTRGIGIIRTPMGFGLAPIRDGDVVPPDEFRKMPEEDQARIGRAIEELGKELEDTARKAPVWEREHREAVRALNQDVTRRAVGHLLEELRTFTADGVPAWLAAVEKDLVENGEAFLQPPPQGQDAVLGLLNGQAEGPNFRRYQVNVLVGHAPDARAPVVYEDNPTHQALVGRAEHQARFGTLFTDFNLLKAGALHRANGGYLILDAHRVLTLGFAWPSLKRALHAQEARIESVEQLLSLVTTSQLEPEPMPLDLKVVLIGDRAVYYLLSQLDPDFTDLFKVAVDFADDMPWDEASTRHYAGLVAGMARRNGLRAFTREGVARVIEQAARAAADSERLSTHHGQLEDLLAEADHAAGERGAEVVDAEDVERAVAAQIERLGRIAERVREEIRRGTILVDTEGTEVGQVNGLAVSMIGSSSFGRPNRITARVRLGKGDVVDIEREVTIPCLADPDGGRGSRAPHRATGRRTPRRRQLPAGHRERQGGGAPRRLDPAFRRALARTASTEAPTPERTGAAGGPTEGVAHQATTTSPAPSVPLVVPSGHRTVIRPSDAPKNSAGSSCPPMVEGRTHFVIVRSPASTVTRAPMAARFAGGPSSRTLTPSGQPPPVCHART
jgi:hypothetical protein